MKSVRIIFIAAAVLFLCACPTLGVIEFNDGLTHDIDYEINEDIRVDYKTPGVYTTVNWLDGASMNEYHYFIGYENSMINIRGGYTYAIYGFGSSQINISGGRIGFVDSRYSSQVDILGGTISYGIVTYDSAKVNIYGATIIGPGFFILQDESEIQIFGSNFRLNGHLCSGVIDSMWHGSYENEPWRYLTGTLLSGEPIDKRFRIGNNARIVLMPEPATVLLLGLGGILLRRRR